jgi:hypothetical protein
MESQLESIALDLGVDVSACANAKSVFREIALRTHPDKVAGKEETFKKASHLYEQITGKGDSPGGDGIDFWMWVWADNMNKHFDEMREDLKEIRQMVEELKKAFARGRKHENEEQRRRSSVRRRWRNRRNVLLRERLAKNPSAFGPFTPLVEESSDSSDSSDYDSDDSSD